MIRWQRRTGLAQVAAPIVAVVLALAVGALSLLAVGKNPLAAYGALATGALGGLPAIAGTLVEATPLIITGLAVGLSFQSGFFNIGAGGQLGMGALAAALVGGYVHAPGPIVMVLMVVAAALAGALWGGIAGALRAYTGASEIITTLMLNYVTIYLMDYAVTGPFRAPGAINQTPPLAGSSMFPVLIPGTSLTATFILAIALVGAVWFLLARSTFGFELRMVGRNPDAARAAGMSVKRVSVLSLAISGCIAGLAGAALIGGVLGSLPQDFSINTGYDAIAVALLGANQPFGILLASLLLGVLYNGSSLMEVVVGVAGPFVGYLEAVMIIFVALPQLRGWLRRRRSAT